MVSVRFVTNKKKSFLAANKGKVFSSFTGPKQIDSSDGTHYLIICVFLKSVLTKFI